MIVQMEISCFANILQKDAYANVMHVMQMFEPILMEVQVMEDLLATFRAESGVGLAGPSDGGPFGAMGFVGGGRTAADLGHKGSGFATPRDSATSGGNRQQARLWRGAS